ncbi:WD40 repeat-like protein [Trametes cingulata]|nr:WD40 repeat-like protein [Trametes cingulata]
MPLEYQQHLRLAHSEAHRDAVTTVAFSPHGQVLGTGGLDGRVCVWDVASGKLLYVFSGKSPVLSLVWLQSNERLVCGMQDGTVATMAISANLINLEGFLAHRGPVERLAFNGTYLASGAQKEVKVWAHTPARSWKLAAELSAPRRSSYTTACEIMVSSLHWTTSVSYPLVLLVTYLSHGIAAFDGRTWARIGSTSMPGYIADASLTRDGRVLAVSNMLTGFELFSIKGLVELEPLFSFKQDVSRGLPIPVCFLHGDHALMGGTSHGKVNIWDVYSRKKQSLALGGEISVLAVAAHYDEARDVFFVATGLFNRGAPSSIVLWRTRETRRQRAQVSSGAPSRPFASSPAVYVLLFLILAAGWYVHNGTGLALHYIPYHPTSFPAAS